MKLVKITLSLFRVIGRYIWQPIVFMTLVVSGGYVFVYLESSQVEEKNRSRNHVHLIEKKLTKIYNLTKQEMDDYFKERTRSESMQGGLDPIDAFALCLSIALTTGWGRYVPTTRESKIFFFFYSVISIAITGGILKNLSDATNEMGTRVINWFERVILRRSRQENVAKKCFFLSCLFVFISATASSWLQFYFEKSTLDSVYITFQAYTTIGFGDIEQFEDELFGTTPKFLTIGLLIIFLRLLGIVLVATLINSYVRYRMERAQLIREKLRKLSAKATKTKKKEVPRNYRDNLSYRGDNQQSIRDA